MASYAHLSGNDLVFLDWSCCCVSSLLLLWPRDLVEKSKLDLLRWLLLGAQLRQRVRSHVQGCFKHLLLRKIVSLGGVVRLDKLYIPGIVPHRDSDRVVYLRDLTRLLVWHEAASEVEDLLLAELGLLPFTIRKHSADNARVLPCRRVPHYLGRVRDDSSPTSRGGLALSLSRFDCGGRHLLRSILERPVLLRAYGRDS